MSGVVRNKPMYLGWRSQEKLDTSGTVSTPTERLARTAVTTYRVEQVENNIKQVTDAILDFCNTSIDDDCHTTDNDIKGIYDDNVDNDSGIDRNEDFTKDVLNELSFRNGKSLYSF